METLAAALSGQQPMQAEGGSNGFIWYDRVTRGIRLRDGRGIRVSGDQHPDPFVEMIRWQGHEGGLMQADGRGARGQSDGSNAVQRRSGCSTPACRSRSTRWCYGKPPSVLIMTAAEGVMLTAPVDMVRLWPNLWPNEKGGLPGDRRRACRRCRGSSRCITNSRGRR